MAEVNLVPEEVSHATNAMLVDEPYHGVYYASLQLSGRNIAKPVDSQGEGLLLPLMAVSYWPGGAQGVQRDEVVSMDLTDAAFVDGAAAINEDFVRASEARRQIFGMGLADTTLVGGRYVKGTLARIGVDHNALGISRNQKVPLGAVVVSRVVEHNQMRSGDLAAHLYFPTVTTYPAFILRALKVALPAYNYRG